MSEKQQQVETLAAELGITMTVEFVPWSKSRNKDDKEPSLNWKVTLHHWIPANHVNPRPPFLTTDYMAGSGHCRSYKNPVKFADGRVDKYSQDQVIKMECETGKLARIWPGGGVGVQSASKVIQPNLADVLYALLSDAEAINYGSFEEWANDAGYETDSRKAEATYRACLETGLKLRNALGEDALRRLREALQDY